MIVAPATSRRTANICFHGVGRPSRELEPGEDRFWLDEAEFLPLLDELADAGDAVSLSVDDGNASDVEIVLPALRERGLRATFFVIVDRLDQPGSLSTSDLGALSAAGMTIGSHGWTHAPWNALAAGELHREVVEARDVLSALVGQEVSTAALPLGQYSRQVLRASRQAGYARLFSSDRQRAGSHQWLQARFSVEHGVTPESLRDTVRRSDRKPSRLYSAAKCLGKRLR
ncbi:polysaccharide deacetylase family protein [Flexivirga sp. B27]